MTLKYHQHVMDAYDVIKNVNNKEFGEKKCMVEEDTTHALF